MTQRLDEVTRLSLMDKHLEGNSYIHELDLIADMLEAAPLGIKSTDLAVLCGYHWSDFSSIQHTLKALREQYGLKLKTYSNFTHKLNYFIVITEENAPHLRHLKACSRAVRQAGLQEPEALTEARAKAKAERATAHRINVQARAEAEARKWREYREQQLRALIDATGLHTLTYPDICAHLHVSKVYARKLVSKWIADGLLTQNISGGQGRGGRGYRSVFSASLPPNHQS